MDYTKLYASVGGNYETAKSRLVSDALIHRLLLKFLHNEDYAELERALAHRDDESAFRAAHTIKGVALNLGLDDLGRSASALTEALRGGRKPEADALFEVCRKDYEHTMAVLQTLND